MNIKLNSVNNCESCNQIYGIKLMSPSKINNCKIEDVYWVNNGNELGIGVIAFCMSNTTYNNPAKILSSTFTGNYIGFSNKEAHTICSNSKFENNKIGTLAHFNAKGNFFGNLYAKNDYYGVYIVQDFDKTKSECQSNNKILNQLMVNFDLCTVADNNYGFYIKKDNSTNPSVVSISHSIIADNSNWGIYVDNPTSSGNESEITYLNIKCIDFYNNGENGEQHYYNPANTPSEDEIPLKIYEDPLFYDRINYYLRTDSPCIDYGIFPIDLGSATWDGKPDDSFWDLGWHRYPEDPPPKPLNLNASVSNQSIYLSWDRPQFYSDLSPFNDLICYKIQLFSTDNRVIKTYYSNEESFTLTDIPTLSFYKLKVYTMNKDGKFSKPSEIIVY